MNPIIKAENLTFSYPGDEESKPVRALSGVSFEIPEGSFTAVLGHNGSGKSTLAKLLCMVNLPDSGRLWVAGREITSPDATEADILAARRDVGMVFQNPDNQIVATIVEEDVAFGCENLGLPPAEIRKRVDEALAAVGMTEYARKQAYNLSGGQKQRVAIAGTIAMNRRCIIFDESTAMLDPMGRREVMEIIRRLNREQGVTVLLITHHMNEAAMADRILVMNQGKIILDGTPSKVFGSPDAMWKAGLDVPQTTELAYKLRRAGIDVPLDLFDPDDCAKAVAAAVQRKMAKSGRGGKS